MYIVQFLIMCNKCFIHLKSIIIIKSRDSSVGIATRLGAARPGFDSRQGQEIFAFSIAFRPALELTQPHIQRVRGGGGPIPWSKAAGHEADHSPPI
jgi:hypothetical protein